LLAENPFCLNGPSPETALELGIGSYRLHLHWFRGEPDTGVYDFSFTDLAANYLRDYGIQPIVIFKCTPGVPDTSIHADTSGWSCCEKEFWIQLHDSTSPTNELSWFPEDTTRWKNFVKAFVERYDGDGIDDYPFLVEPFSIYQFEVEYPRVWCDCTPDPVQDYIDYINLSYNAAKSADPSAIVKMAGFGSDLILFYEGYIPGDSFFVTRDSIRDYYVTRAMLASSDLFLDNRERFMRIYGEASYDYYDMHCYGREYLMKYRPAGFCGLFGDKPTVAGEGGGPFAVHGEHFNPENDSGHISPELAEENAAYVVRYYLGGLLGGFVYLAWHCPPEYEAWGQLFGDLDLMSIDYEKKPSYWTYAGLSAMIADYDSVVEIPSLEDGQYGCRVFTPEREYFALWDYEGSEFEFSITDGTLAEYIFPTEMGDSLWDTLTSEFSSDTLISIPLSRIPRIFSLDDGSTISSENKTVLPSSFTISAYPNPFNSAVTIAFDIPVGDGSPVPVSVQIYDVNGRRVAELPEYGTVGEALVASRNVDSGVSEREGTSPSPTIREFTWSPDESLPSGVYLVRARIGPSTLRQAQGTASSGTVTTGGGRGDLAPTGNAQAVKRIVYLK
jgi:hypothetical protein